MSADPLPPDRLASLDQRTAEMMQRARDLGRVFAQFLAGGFEREEAMMLTMAEQEHLHAMELGLVVEEEDA